MTALDLNPYLPAHDNTINPDAEPPLRIPPGYHELTESYTLNDAGGPIEGSGSAPFIASYKTRKTLSPETLSWLPNGVNQSLPSNAFMGSATYLINNLPNPSDYLFRLSGSHVNLRDLAFVGGNPIRVEKRKGWFSGKHSSRDLFFDWCDTAITAGDSDGNADHLSWHGHIGCQNTGTFYKIVDNQSMSHIFTGDTWMGENIDIVFDVRGGGIVNANHLSIITPMTVFDFSNLIRNETARSNDTFVIKSVKYDASAFDRPNMTDEEVLSRTKLVLGGEKPSASMFFSNLHLSGRALQAVPFKYVDVSGSWTFDFFGARNFPDRSLFYTPGERDGLTPTFLYFGARGIPTNPANLIHPESEGECYITYIGCKRDNGVRIPDQQGLYKAQPYNPVT